MQEIELLRVEIACEAERDGSNRGTAQGAYGASMAMVKNTVVTGTEFHWLPAARAWRYALVIVATGLGALTFAAWLRPNMVFDLANMIFCG